MSGWACCMQGPAPTAQQIAAMPQNIQSRLEEAMSYCTTLIRESLDESNAADISTLEDPFLMWQQLHANHINTTPANQISLNQEWNDISISSFHKRNKTEQEIISSYLTAVQSLADKLRLSGDIKTPVQIYTKAVSGLGEEYRYHMGQLSTKPPAEQTIAGIKNYFKTLIGFGNEKAKDLALATNTRRGRGGHRGRESGRDGRQDRASNLKEARIQGSRSSCIKKQICYKAIRGECTWGDKCHRLHLDSEQLKEVVKAAGESKPKPPPPRKPRRPRVNVVQEQEEEKGVPDLADESEDSDAGEYADEPVQGTRRIMVHTTSTSPAPPRSQSGGNVPDCKAPYSRQTPHDCGHRSIWTSGP